MACNTHEHSVAASSYAHLPTIDGRALHRYEVQMVEELDYSKSTYTELDSNSILVAAMVGASSARP